MTRSYHQHYRVTDDGVRLFARLYDGAEDRVPLLCLHGLTRNSADFADMLALLPEWPAISVDQRGRGNSGADPDPSHYRPDIYCEDMLNLLDELDHEQVIAVGTSMGGLMTLMLANMRPSLLKAAVINDIGPEVDPAGLDRLRAYVGQATEFSGWDDAIEAIRAQGPDIFPDYTDEDWRDFAGRVCEEDSHGRVRFRYDPAISNSLKDDGEAAVPPDLWPLFTAPESLPMLIIRGETSDILSPEVASRMVQERPDARLVTVPKRGHAPMLTEPVAIASIRAFLEAQL